MRITESQLRRIIRQEVRQLTEMPARRPPGGRGRGHASEHDIASDVVKIFTAGHVMPYELVEFAAEELTGKDPEIAMRRPEVREAMSEILDIVMGFNPKAAAAFKLGLGDFT